MAQEIFVTEEGVQVSIEVTFDYEDGCNLKYATVIVSHPGDWQMHLASAGVAGDTYELELQWAQEENPDYNDYLEPDP